MRQALDLDTLTLYSGAHAARTDGVCLLEAVAWMAGEEHGDAPACVDVTLARFGRRWNDGMRTDDERGQLVPYVPALVGTAGTPEDAERRAWMALDWSVRVSTPAWLDLAGMADIAQELRDRPALDGPDEVTLGLLTTARGQAAAAAASDAAWDAAGAAAGAAASDAAWDAAWDAAGAAAWDAAWDAAGAAAGAAAWDAAWAAAWVAAGAALEPTVTDLQASAHSLYLAMIEAGPHNPTALAVARAQIGGAS